MSLESKKLWCQLRDRSTIEKKKNLDKKNYNKKKNTNTNTKIKTLIFFYFLSKQSGKNTNKYTILYQTRLFLTISSLNPTHFGISSYQLTFSIFLYASPSLFSILLHPIPCLCPLFFAFALFSSPLPTAVSQCHHPKQWLSNSHLPLQFARPKPLSLSLSLSSICTKWSFLSLLP